ncbi:transcriptional repressor [Candidatus Sumerlaeota bacterium]|nr:transcriptional repressor [Candidatus Sumerlaeota bacterium]
MQRKTTQRQAIRDAFMAAGRPLGPEEVLKAAKKRGSTLGIATVYRAINALLAEAWLQAVRIPGEPARYELRELPHHHHFHCKRCGKVYDLKSCPGKLEALAPAGFIVQSHELTLTGLCADCA